MGLTALLAIALATAACSGGSSSSGSSTAGSTPGAPVAKTLPTSGTVRLSDGITYTVAAPGQTLSLDNLSLKIRSMRWQKDVSVPVKPD